MKKMIATFMAVICLVLCYGNSTALAGDVRLYSYCPYCRGEVFAQSIHITEWSTKRTFTDSNKSLECEEFYSYDRVGIICKNGDGVVQDVYVTTVTHSLVNCPYKD